jgi:predicted hydrolase (HD superfamily)
VGIALFRFCINAFGREELLLRFEVRLNPDTTSAPDSRQRPGPRWRRNGANHLSREATSNFRRGLLRCYNVPMPFTPNREAAWQLLTEYTKSDSLLKHAMAVEAAVGGYARLFNQDEEGWGVVGLLHDFDYERWPGAADHPFRGCEILREQGYPDWVIHAILSHADYSGVPRDGLLERTLFACDEMAGFITAASLVRPSRSVLDLEAKSVVRRMKDKAFARAVKREDLVGGA